MMDGVTHDNKIILSVLPVEIQVYNSAFISAGIRTATPDAGLCGHNGVLLVVKSSRKEDSSGRCA
jgi:hypothetical protein